MLPLTDKYPQLARPPLREALIDIRLRDRLPEDWGKRLESVQFRDFKVTHPLKEGGFRFEIPRDDAPASAKVLSAETLGYRYDRTNGTQTLLVRRNGMSLSILKNYTTWEALKEAANDLWTEYLRLSGSVQVDRLAVRYINAIEMTVSDDTDEYLTAGPRIPEKLPQILNSFFQRVEIPFLKEKATAIITQASGDRPPEGSSNREAILDIDVFCSGTFDGASPGIWITLDNLRDIANRSFFSSITKQVLDSYL